MLKNLKVGTKLVAILVAPVLVLIALAYVGVSTRLDDAASAQRVEELTRFMQTDSLLMKELELEGLYSSRYAASGGTEGKDEMVAQRGKTDAAYQAWEVEKATLNNEPEVQDALKGANSRLKLLSVTRGSVDDVQKDALGLAEEFHQIVTDVFTLSEKVAQLVEDPELSQGLQSYLALANLTDKEANTATLLIIPVEIGFYAGVLPTSSSRTAAVGDCGTNPAGAGDKCKIYSKSLAANDEFASADAAFTNAAYVTGDQKQIKRFADAGEKLTALKKTALQDGQPTTVGGETQDLNDLTGEAEGSKAVTTGEFIPAATDRIEKLFTAQSDVLVKDNATSVLGIAEAKAADAQRGATLYLLFTAAAILLAAFITVAVARAITVPLRKLTSAAYVLSTQRLPALVERLRNPEEDNEESLAATLTPIDINSKDEIGQLADSFNSIQQVTVEVAEEQSVLLRKGIGDIFINLARRNQTLLDRQIEFIDQLEANEEDPDQLDNLFKLDHLATRMRRNAESLLVLAGAEPPRRRGRPVALADVVRVAIGEVEDFARIQLLALDDATVGGNVAVDLAHLLSELMENATHFSPPDTMVEIVGHRSDTGYIISVSDQGIGMSADQLGEANTQLARPPLVGLALSRSLGFIVIGRLAQRFEVSVKLTASPSGGVTALVTLPNDLVTYEGEELPPPAAELSQAATVAPEATVESFEDDEVVVLDDEVEAVPEPVGLSDDSLLDELVEEGIGDSDEFERGLQEILSDDGGSATSTLDSRESVPGAFAVETATDDATGQAEAAPVEVAVEDEPEVAAEPEPEPEPEPAPVAVVRPEPVVTVAEQIAAASRAEAKEASLTAAGLVKRTPKKRTPEPVGSAGPSSQQPRATGASQRSPEEVRKMLSRYRSGLNKGRTTADSENTDS